MDRRSRSLLCLFLCLLLLAGCGTTPDETTPVSSSVQSDAEHSVTVTDLAGNPVSDVIVRVFSDDTLSDLKYAGKTDEKGVFSFVGPKSETYAAALSRLPVCHTANESYPLTGEDSRIELGVAVMAEEHLDSVAYSLGDVVMDFTFTDVDGTQYTLSQLLKDKKAVVLNFWFMGCPPCKAEFPHMQQAYEGYSDEIALLALDPVDGDDATISAFRQENGYTFPMIKCDRRWANVFGAIGYPTTVVIDRYYNIVLTHRGTIPDTKVFEDMFAHFSAETYEQTFYSGVDQIPA